MRVLIADDHPETRSALRLVLQELEVQLGRGASHEERARTSITVVEARNASEAARQLEDGRVDVLLLDWELPALEDSGLLEAIAARSVDCRAIAISGSPEMRKRALGMGMGYFVGKTDPPAKLIQLLRELMFRDPEQQP